MNKKLRKLKREIRMTPAFDKRSDIPYENYGVGAVKLYFSIRGKKGAIELMVFTDWYLPHVQLENPTFKREVQPHLGNLFIHSKKKLYDKQSISSKECRLTGGRCYTGGSALMADAYLDCLREKGSKGVFKMLKKEYFDQFYK